MSSKIQRIRLLLGNMKRGQKIVLGRGDFKKDLGFAITEESVSRKHCEIERSGESCIVRDLGSELGTFIQDGAGFFIGVSEKGKILTGDGESIWLGHRVQLRLGDEEHDERPMPEFSEILEALGTWSVIIGRAFPRRAGSIGIVLSDRKVSKEHAVLRLVEAADHHIEVQDLDSANGVFVNGHRIRARVTLRPGDELAIGDEFKLKIPPPNRRQRKPTVIRNMERETELLLIEQELTAARQRLWELKPGEVLVLGRKGTKEGGVDLGDKFVSAVHLRVTREQNKNGERTYRVSDCSSNGTWVNGEPLAKHSEGTVLSEGDELVLGHPESKYRFALPGKEGRVRRNARGGARFEDLFATE